MGFNSGFKGLRYALEMRWKKGIKSCLIDNFITGCVQQGRVGKNADCFYKRKYYGLLFIQ